jgi:hypothetical protein
VSQALDGKEYDVATIQAACLSVLDDSKEQAEKVGFNEELLPLTCVKKDGDKCFIKDPTPAYVKAAQEVRRRPGNLRHMA